MVETGSTAAFMIYTCGAAQLCTEVLGAPLGK